MLELKEKLGSVSSAPESTHLGAREALVELGYSPVEAERALANVDAELPIEEQVRLALREAA